MAKGRYLHSYRAHLAQSVKELFNQGRIDLIIIPGGATGHIQVADRSWNKTIKDQQPVDG